MSDEPEQGKSGQERGAKDASPKKALPRRASYWHRHALLLMWLGALALMLLLALRWVVRYVESPQFNERARQYVVQQIERASGGRVELQRLAWNWRRLEFELDGLTIHGTEAAGEASLLQVELARARLSWTELLAGKLVLSELQVLHPLAHVDVYQDGSTNFPGVKAQGAENRVQKLFRLAVDQAELVDGRLDWNQQKIRLDGIASGIYLEVGYRALDMHYEVEAQVGQVRMRLPQYEPLTLGAEGEFRLYHDRVEVPRLRVNEGHGWVELNGAVSGLASPVAQFAYRAEGDAAEAARLVRYPELKSGAVQLSGQGTYRWDRGEYAVVGKAQASGVGWADEIVRLEKINGGFMYSLDREHFNVSSIFATALGGTVHGKMDTSHLTGKEAVGQIDLQVTGVELASALRAFATEELPLERLPLSGSTAGTLLVHWRGSPLNALMDGNLQVQPVARAGQLPVTAVVQATVDFKSQSVQVHSVDASAPETHLSVQGRLAANSDLKLDVTTAKLAELGPMVAAWRGSRARDLPIEFAGQAAFRGSVQGKLESPSISGYMELHDFTTVVRVPSWGASEAGTAPLPAAGALAGTAPLPAAGALAGNALLPAAGAGAGATVRTRWDLLEGEVHYSAIGESLRNGVLRKGGATIDLDASLALLDGNYDRRLPFAARVKVDNAEVGELQTLLGSSYPVTGRVSGELEASGVAGHLSGSGHVTVKDGTAWGQAVRSASAELRLTENQAQLRNIVLKSNVMQLTGDARINVESREFGFDLKGTEVKLEGLRALSGIPVRLSGTAAFEASGEGTPSAPVINGRLRLSNLAIGGQAIGGVDVLGVTHGAELTLTARSSSKSAEVKLDGVIHLRGQMPMQMSGELQSTNLNSMLNAYLPLQLAGPSELKMHLDATGEALHPKDMTAEVEVERLATSYGGIAVTNEGPIRLRMEHGVMQVEQFRLSGEQGTRFLQVQGEVQLGDKREIDLRADGSVNLKLLETTDPKLTAGGAANLSLQLTGRLDRPSMHGSLKVQDGSLSYVDFPNGLSDINGSLVFNEDRLQVQELTARTGGGLLHCAGFITYSPAQGLGFNLSGSGQGIRLRYPEGLSSTADASLSLSGSSKNALLSGDVTVTRLGVNPQFDFATYLIKGVRGAPALKIDSPLNRVHLDVHVTSTPELPLQTSALRVSGKVDLHLRGTAFRPVVLGRIDLLEGTFDFNSTKYRMERGVITFTNPVRIYPTLDIELSSRVRDYDITLGFHGPIDRMTTTYRSDPPLSSSDIISLLALGRTSAESANPALMGTSQYQPAVSEGSSMQLLGQALSAAKTNRVQQLFGVSRVKIDPNAGEEVNSGLARVTVEQQISNKVTLTYITNLNQSAQQIIQFEYSLDKSVTLVGVRDQTGVVSFDVVFRKRRR
jgi:translocation and assembly module TamB